MLSIKNINVTFNKGTVDQKIGLDNISLNINDGDFVTIIGSNGSGKSTLFNIISGMIEPDSGIIELDSKIINSVKEHKRAKYIGRLYQNPSLGTSPNMTIEENLAIAYHKKNKLPFSIATNKTNRKYFKQLLVDFDLNLENRMSSKVKLLSGGERQALALLMSTINTPSVLLLDEHTAALDPKTQIQIMKLTNKIIKDKAITTLMITHSINDALNYGNKLLVMNKGKILFFLDEDEKNKLNKSDVLKLYSNYNLDVDDTQILN